jgi:hypothetical protein
VRVKTVPVWHNAYIAILAKIGSGMTFQGVGEGCQPFFILIGLPSSGFLADFDGHQISVQCLPVQSKLLKY